MIGPPHEDVRVIPQDWTIYDETPALRLAAQVERLPNGAIHLKVRYLDLRTDEDGEIERVATSLPDCIHEVGKTIRVGSASGRPGRPLTADGVTELLCRYVNQNRDQIERALGGA